MVTGFFVFGYTGFAVDRPGFDDPNFGEIPTGVLIGAGVCSLGFFMLGIGVIGRLLSKRF